MCTFCRTRLRQNILGLSIPFRRFGRASACPSINQRMPRDCYEISQALDLQVREWKNYTLDCWARINLRRTRDWMVSFGELNLTEWLQFL